MWLWHGCQPGHSYKIVEAPEEQFFGEQSGTKIVLHLREEAQDSWELHRSEGKCVMAMFFQPRMTQVQNGISSFLVSRGDFDEKDGQRTATAKSSQFDGSFLQQFNRFSLILRYSRCCFEADLNWTHHHFFQQVRSPESIVFRAIANVLHAQEYLDTGKLSDLLKMLDWHWQFDCRDAGERWALELARSSCCRVQGIQTNPTKIYTADIYFPPFCLSSCKQGTIDFQYRIHSIL